jgi:hypothetical protein
MQVANGGKGGVELVGMAYGHGLQVQSQSLGIRLHTWELEGKDWIGRIEEESDADDLRDGVLQDL